MRLREAFGSDLDALFALDQICFPAGIAYSAGEIASLLASRRSISLLAEEDETLAGFIIAQIGRTRRERGGHIITLDVAPEFRRAGVGRLLMARLEALMREQGAAWLRLEVAVDNLAALSFYNRLGFTVIGRIRGYYLGTLDALVMEKRLSAATALTG